MTPAQKRNAPLSDATCFHEIGHLYVAQSVALHCDVNFMIGPGTDAWAGAFWGNLNTPLNRVASAMAGVYAQTLYATESVPTSLQESIRTGVFFEDMVRNQTVPSEASFFLEDLRTIWDFVLRCRDQNEQLSLVREGFAQLQQIFAAPHRDAVFIATHRDIFAWLDEDDPDIYAGTPLLLYENERSRPIYERITGTTAASR